MIAIVVARSNNNVIGDSNDLPWYLPADLRHFKEITTGHTVIMGRKTYGSIPEKFRPLPHRRNIIITRNQTFEAPGAIVTYSIEEALEKATDDEIFIIGGAEVYNQAFGVVDRIYLTEVFADIKGDTYFPAIDPDTWKEVDRESHDADEKNQYKYDFVIYDRQ